MQCAICLSEEGTVVQRGCCCRGDAGAVHETCLIEVAKHNSAEDRFNWEAWQTCGTCQSNFTGSAAHTLAETWYNRVQSIPEDDDERTTATLNYAAVLSNETWDHAKAETLKTEVLQTYKRVHGDEDRQTLWCAYSLGVTYRAQGKHQDALGLLSATAEAQRRLFGDEDSDVLDTFVELGSLNRILGRFVEAIEFGTLAMETSRRILGCDHVYTTEACAELAISYSTIGKYDSAITLLSDVVASQSRVLGKQHPSTMFTQNSLSVVEMKSGKFAEAEARARALLDERLRVQGPEHPESVITSFNVGLYMLYRGQPDKAEPQIRTAIANAEEISGFQTLTMHFMVASHAEALCELGRHEEAMPILMDEYAKQAESLGQEHPMVLETASILGWALTLQGDPVKGEDLLRATLDIQERVLGLEVFETRRTAARLAKCAT